MKLIIHFASTVAYGPFAFFAPIIADAVNNIITAFFANRPIIIWHLGNLRMESKRELSYPRKYVNSKMRIR